MSDLVVFLADSALKSSIVLVAAGIATFLLRNRSASMRHWIWGAAVVAVVLIPVLITVIPTWKDDFNISTITRFSPPLNRVEAGDPASIETTEFATGSPAKFEPGFAIELLWLLGAVFVSSLLIREAARLSRLASSAQPFFDSRWFRVTTELRQRFHLKRSVRFVQSSTSSMLVTWGALRPRVLLPSGADRWSDRRMQAVLGHELAHIRRHDWFIQLLGEIARCIFWFNPLVWLACSRLRQESERACDDAVLLLGVESTAYAAELLDLARILKTSSCSWAPSLAMAHPSTLERRFAAMLNPSVDRRSITAKTVFLIGALTVCLTLPVAAMRAPFQYKFGRLFGRVYDPSGGPIKNATITVFDPATSVRDTATSNASGVFEFPSVPAGHYELQTSAIGFEAFQVHSVTVEANQDVNLNILTVAAAVAPPAVPGKAPDTERRGETDKTTPPKLIRRVAPNYPATGPQQQIRDAVVLEAVVGTDGVPKAVRVLTNRGGADVEKAAVDAVKRWRYEPALANGVPVEANVKIAVGVNSGSDEAVARLGSRSVSAFPPPPPPPPVAPSATLAAPAPPPPAPAPGESTKPREIGVQAPQRIRQGGNVQQTMLVSQVKPIYPPDAKAARIQGIVILETLVSKEGDVQSINVISGHPMLQQAAIDAVSQWKYKPTLLNGEPVEVVTTITVNFAFQQ